ncbi:MAG: baseplate J/gp47 family protein [Firmicutes bacterium]|nr:baseplate J/gp47 family protein [[Eubacterium] siraeum]MCM1486777.1 baseplate J/gp47 family protein [Bacillota bacterium]
MREGAAYKFVQTDTEGIIAELAAKYEELTGRTLQPSDPDKLFISWVADIIVQTLALINYSANQNIPSRAEAENLDALGEFVFNLKRPEAEPAECIICFEISMPQEAAITIPKGTQVTDGSKSLVWETTEDTAVAIGETETAVRAVCQTAGTIGNGYAAGQINVLMDVDKVLYFQRCYNIETTSGGSEAADDDTYYQLMRQSLEAYSTAGPKGAYEYHAKAVSSDIGDVCAIAPLGKDGHVEIYAIMADGSIADDGTKNRILEACSDEKVRPLTDIVEVCDPEVVDYDIDLTYYVDQNSSKSVKDIAEAVLDGVDRYVAWQGEKIGRDINPSKLIWFLKDTGIKRVDVRAPVFVSLRDGADRTAPQYPRLKETSIKNGGFEDE